MSLPPETELSNLMPWVDGATRVFGVIAHPVDHVRAPMVFNPRFAAAGLPHIMVPINAPPEKLELIINALRAMPNFGGLAVTIPHKMPLADLCDSLGTAAQLTRAVNAVRFDDDGTMHGDNFDGAGFVAGAIGNGYDVADKAVLLIGAGGAARAIAAALVEVKIGKLTIANRSLGKAEELASLLASKTGFANVHATALADCDGGDADMIINSTSLGLKPGDALPLVLDAVRPDTVIADIIMVPAETEWLAAAQKTGLRVHYGRHMLDYQIDLIGKFIGAL
ncbi:shikimate dehydrogenase [Alphaproteobacteria bacterium]|jgi:shikimate dehydrogenase|nr:shikimate dehydrogenase [Alphaproteobacteria bacterium]